MKPMEPTETQWNGIKAAIRAGNKIEAIKLYREATGASLLDAKEAVERIDASPSAPLPSPAGEIDEARIRELLLKGSKIEAIKQVREATRLGLKEAKDIVDGIDERTRAESPDYAARPVPRGCAGLLLVGVGILALAAGGITLTLLRGT